MMHASILIEGPTYFYGQDAEFQGNKLSGVGMILTMVTRKLIFLIIIYLILPAEVPKGQGCIEERSGKTRIRK